MGNAIGSPVGLDSGERACRVCSVPVGGIACGPAVLDEMTLTPAPRSRVAFFDPSSA